MDQTPSALSVRSSGKWCRLRRYLRPTDFGVYVSWCNPFSGCRSLSTRTWRFDVPNRFANQLSWRGGRLSSQSAQSHKLFRARLSDTHGDAVVRAVRLRLVVQRHRCRFANGLAVVAGSRCSSIELAADVRLSKTASLSIHIYYKQIRNKIEFSQISDNLPGSQSRQSRLFGDELWAASSTRVRGYAYAAQLTKNENVATASACTRQRISVALFAARLLAARGFIALDLKPSGRPARCFQSNSPQQPHQYNFAHLCDVRPDLELDDIFIFVPSTRPVL